MDDPTQRICRAFFGSSEGKAVLAHMLRNARFFDYTKTPEEQAVENFVKEILSDIGVWNMDNADSFVELLMNLPMIETPKVKEDENG